MSKVGFYITGTYLRIGAWTEEGSFREYALDIKNLGPESIASTLASFLKRNGIEPQDSILFIARHNVFFRILTVPSVETSEILQMVEHKRKTFFPYKPDELVFDSVILSKGEDGFSRVGVVAVKKDYLLSQIQLFAEAGIVLSRVYPSFFSLWSQANLLEKKRGPVMLVSIEDDAGEFLTLQNGGIISSRGISIPGEPARTIVHEALITLNSLISQGVLPYNIICGSRGIEVSGMLTGLESEEGLDVDYEKGICISRGAGLPHPAIGKSFNLFPSEHKVRSIRANFRKTVGYCIVLIFINLALMGNYAFLKIKDKKDYSHFLASQIAVLNTETSLLRGKKRQLDVLNRSSYSGKQLLAMMNELYEKFGGNIQLQSLIVKNGMGSDRIVVVSGESTDSESIHALSSRIEESAFFKKASLEFIKASENRPGKFEFAMKVTY